MRRIPAVASLLVLSVLPISLLAQQSAQTAIAPMREPQAVAVLQHSFAAMGRTLPADSVATGTVTIVEGSRTEEGTIRIATRGPDQSVEDITTPTDRRVVVYSRLAAIETKSGNTKVASLELASSSQTPEFPMPLIAWALNSPEASASYVGLEEINGALMHHIRIWNSFASRPELHAAAEFTVKDIWIDGTKFLPQKVTYHRRVAGGSVPRIPVELVFEDYHEVSGIFYPFLIQKRFNGTLWTTITISTVKLNSGLTDTDFPVTAGGVQ